MLVIPTFAVFHAFSSGALWLLAVLIFIGFDGTNRKANHWLGLFYGILACTFAQLYLEASGTGTNLLIHLLELPRWAMQPSLYIAVYYYTSPATRRPKYGWLHFVPFLLFFLFSIFYILPGIFHEQHQLPVLAPWMRFVIRYFFLGQALYYWASCFYRYRLHQNNIKTIASYTEKINLEWLHYLLISILFLILISIASKSNTSIAYGAPLLYFLAILPLAYWTLAQKSIYVLEASPAAEKDKLPVKKQLNERLSAEQVAALQSIVERKTKDEKLYLDPLLTLSMLSDKVGISTHELSYVLNNGLNKTFYQFINELRTAEAMTLLLSDELQHLDLLGIAIRAGFNSKTTFYSSFKKITGLTPKAYLKSHKKTD